MSLTRRLRTLAFASILISPLHVTPWLLLREERQHTAGLCRTLHCLETFHRLTLSCIAMLYPHNFRFFSHWSPSAFQHSLALLIRYRSCAPYLDLEVDCPHIPARIPADHTLPGSLLFASTKGLLPAMAPYSKGL